MSAFLEGIATGLPIAVDGILHDIAPSAVHRSFLDTLLRVQDGMKKRGIDIQKSSRVDGTGLRVDMKVANPVTSGFLGKTAALADHKIPPQRHFNHVAGTMDFSWYRGAERITKDTAQRIGSNSVEAIQNYVMEVGKAIADSIHERLDEDFFPAVTVSPSVGAPAENKVMAIRYPLLSGYTDNEATGSGSYTYLGHNLNSGFMVNAKAISSGSVASAFGVPSTSNLRTKVLMRLMQERKARNLFALTDFAIVDYMINQGESKYQITVEDSMTYGASELAKYAGVYFCPNYRHNLLADNSLDRVIDFIEPSTWHWHSEGLGETEVISPVPDEPTMHSAIQWAFKCAILCANPRINGLAYKVTLS